MKLKGVVNCKSVKETLALGKAYASELKSGDVLAFVGDLGSGKTTFMKGLATGLGFKNKEEVTSPTFTLMNVYQGTCPIYHFDLYRLDTTKDILSIGFDEFTDDPNAIACIEWAEKAGKLIPANAKTIHFKLTGETTRRITLP